MRDIIRCGLAMIVCFAALAGLYVIAGAPLVAAAAGAGLHRRDQRARAVRDHAHPDQGGARAGSCSRPRPCPRRSRPSLLAIVIAIVVASTDWPASEARWSATEHRGPRRRRCSRDYTLPFEVVSVLLLAAVIGGVFLAKRERGDGD